MEESTDDSSSSNSIPAMDSSPPDLTNRVECAVCYERFSATLRSRHPIVSSCGHSFCRHCASKLRNKCAVCRHIFVGEKNMSLIAALEERRVLRTTIKNLKRKLLDQGMTVDPSDGESDEQDCTCKGNCEDCVMPEADDFVVFHPMRGNPARHLAGQNQDRPVRRYINTIMETVQRHRQAQNDEQVPQRVERDVPFRDPRRDEDVSRRLAALRRSVNELRDRGGIIPLITMQAQPPTETRPQQQQQQAPYHHQLGGRPFYQLHRPFAEAERPQHHGLEVVVIENDEPEIQGQVYPRIVLPGDVEDDHQEYL